MTIRKCPRCDSEEVLERNTFFGKHLTCNQCHRAEYADQFFNYVKRRE